MEVIDNVIVGLVAMVGLRVGVSEGCGVYEDSDVGEGSGVDGVLQACKASTIVTKQIITKPLLESIVHTPFVFRTITVTQ